MRSCRQQASGREFPAPARCRARRSIMGSSFGARVRVAARPSNRPQPHARTTSQFESPTAGIANVQQGDKRQGLDHRWVDQLRAGGLDEFHSGAGRSTDASPSHVRLSPKCQSRLVPAPSEARGPRQAASFGAGRASWPRCTTGCATSTRRRLRSGSNTKSPPRGAPTYC